MNKYSIQIQLMSMDMYEVKLGHKGHTCFFRIKFRMEKIWNLFLWFFAN